MNGSTSNLRKQDVGVSQRTGMKPFLNVEDLIQFAGYDAAGAFGFVALIAGRTVRANIFLNPLKVETVPEGEAGRLLNGLRKQGAATA